MAALERLRFRPFHINLLPEAWIFHVVSLLEALDIREAWHLTSLCILLLLQRALAKGEVNHDVSQEAGCAKLENKISSPALPLLSI